MSKLYRIKTKEEFEACGGLNSNGVPKGWNRTGKMNHFMGMRFPESKIIFGTGITFNIRGETWVFSKEDIAETITDSSALAGLRTPVKVTVSADPIIVDMSKPKKSKKSAITQGTDAYKEKVYIGDTVVFSPNSSTIYRGEVIGFTPKANPRVKIEGVGCMPTHSIVCQRPYVKIHVPLNGKRMVDLIHNIK